MGETESGVLFRLRRLIEGKGLSQRALSEKTGIPQYRISRLLSGSPFPSLDELFLFANCLGVSLYYLLGVEPAGKAELSDKEKKLLDSYAKASLSVKSVVDKILDI